MTPSISIYHVSQSSSCKDSCKMICSLDRYGSDIKASYFYGPNARSLRLECKSAKQTQTDDSGQI